MYRELVEHKLSNRNTIVHVSEILPIAREYEAYESVFLFDNQFPEWVKINGSVEMFSGNVYIDGIIIDIDNKSNLELAKSSVIKLASYLIETYNITPDDLSFFFSGAKGFHVLIPSRLIGDIKPSKILNSVVKEFVVTEFINNKIEYIDLSIYDKTRIIRIPNSLNLKSGLYKIQLSFDEITSLPLGDIMDLAKEPRLDFKRPKPIVSVQQNDEIFDVFSSLYKEMLTPNVASESDEYKGFFDPPKDGDRNVTIFKQASMIMDLTSGKIKPHSLMSIMNSINANSSPPLKQYELNTIVENSIDRYNKKAYIKSIESEPSFKSFHEWIPVWESVVEDKSSELSLSINRFDNDLEYQLRGKLGIIVGYGGSKKSLLAQQILLHNIDKYEAVGAYSTMEMPAHQMLNRVIDFSIEPYNNQRASAVLKRGYEEKKEDARGYLYNNVGKRYNDKLFISQKGRLDTSNYEYSIKEILSKTGRFDILVVDGLSLMHSNGKEVDDYNKHTAELKSLANEYNILVILICHVSKGGHKHTRDLLSLMRGSQKIEDNGDFFVSMSQIIDKDRTTDDVTEYRTDIGYMRLYNKRGTGNTINTIYNFNPLRLSLSETVLEPREFEIKSENNNYQKKQYGGWNNF